MNAVRLAELDRLFWNQVTAHTDRRRARQNELGNILLIYSSGRN